MAGNGASLAPATSNPRLAREDNGCLIFSIRRAQCRILSFTRGGASEVISQRHSARTLLLCGGARTPASAGISAGRVCSCGLFKGARGPAAVGTTPPPRAPPRRPALGRRGWDPPPPGPGRRPRSPPGQARAAGPRALAAAVSPHHTHFHRDLKCRFLLSPGSQRAKKGGRRRCEGDGSLTQSADLRGVEQMVPLTPAAELAALRAPGSGPDSARRPND